MGIARFLLVAGVTPAGVGVPGWPGRSGVQGGGDADRAWTAWRLLGGNNRELGRSAEAFPDVAAAVAAIATLRSRFADLAATHQTDERGRWRWRLTADDVAVVVSSRAYLRQRESHYSLAQFLAVAPHADGPRLRPSGTLPAQPPAPVGEPPVAEPGTTQLQRSRRTPVPMPTGRAVVLPLPTPPSFPRRTTPGAAWAR